MEVHQVPIILVALVVIFGGCLRQTGGRLAIRWSSQVEADMGLLFPQDAFLLHTGGSSAGSEGI